eukprot:3488090-Rhodomonas_salina.1
MRKSESESGTIVIVVVTRRLRAPRDAPGEPRAFLDSDTVLVHCQVVALPSTKLSPQASTTTSTSVH